MPYDYSWYKYRVCDFEPRSSLLIEPKYIPCGYWYPAGDNSNTLTLRLFEDHRIKVEITDANDQTAAATKYVSVGSGGLAKAFAENPLDQSLPTTYALAPVHPNPFNPATTIRYYLLEASNVNLTIYNMMGREVVTWSLQEEPGYKQIVWDGKDHSGRLAPAGIYIYRFTATSVESDKRFTASRKMVLMK